MAVKGSTLGTSQVVQGSEDDQATMISDHELAKVVRLAVRHDHEVTASVRVKVADRWVTLSGEMDDERQREDLVRAVGLVPGVLGVSNLILIRPRLPAIEPEAIKEAIERALEQQADRDAQQIAVAIEHGTVVLTGDVRSWTERCAVIGAAGHTPGVLSVTDHLHFKSPS
jgi:osmotically-inducible protein OsmY